MSKSKITIVLLVTLLIASNAWWLYHAIDSGVTATYREVSLRDNHEALAQTLAILAVVTRPAANRAQVLDAATRSARLPDTFENDGFVWVGRLGLKFNDDGQLVEVTPAWSPF